MPLPFAQADARSLYELLIDPERVGWRSQKNSGDTSLLFGQSLLDLPRTHGRVVLASQRVGAVSQEQMEQGHGVFMAHLLDALEGEAANPRTGRITLGTLYDYLDET